MFYIFIQINFECRREVAIAIVIVVREITPEITYTSIYENSKYEVQYYDTLKSVKFSDDFRKVKTAQLIKI